jgi:hypothetical protein
MLFTETQTWEECWADKNQQLVRENSSLSIIIQMWMNNCRDEWDFCKERMSLEDFFEADKKLRLEANLKRSAWPSKFIVHRAVQNTVEECLSFLYTDDDVEGQGSCDASATVAKIDVALSSSTLLRMCSVHTTLFVQNSMEQETLSKRARRHHWEECLWLHRFFGSLLTPQCLTLLAEMMPL